MTVVYISYYCIVIAMNYEGFFLATRRTSTWSIVEEYKSTKVRSKPKQY